MIHYSTADLYGHHPTLPCIYPQINRHLNRSPVPPYRHSDTSDSIYSDTYSTKHVQSSRKKFRTPNQRYDSNTFTFQIPTISATFFCEPFSTKKFIIYSCYILYSLVIQYFQTFSIVIFHFRHITCTKWQYKKHIRI